MKKRETENYNKKVCRQVRQEAPLCDWFWRYYLKISTLTVSLDKTKHV